DTATMPGGGGLVLARLPAPPPGGARQVGGRPPHAAPSPGAAPADREPADSRPTPVRRRPHQGLRLLPGTRRPHAGGAARGNCRAARAKRLGQVHGPTPFPRLPEADRGAVRRRRARLVVAKWRSPAARRLFAERAAAVRDHDRAATHPLPVRASRRTKCRLSLWASEPARRLAR